MCHVTKVGVVSWCHVTHISLVIYSNLFSTVCLASVSSCLTSTGPMSLYTTAPSSNRSISWRGGRGGKGWSKWSCSFVAVPTCMHLLDCIILVQLCLQFATGDDTSLFVWREIRPRDMHVMLQLQVSSTCAFTKQHNLASSLPLTTDLFECLEIYQLLLEESFLSLSARE